MKVKLSTLENNMFVKFMFRFIKQCQVVLDTGTVLDFTRGSGLFATSINSKKSLTKAEKEQADKLMEM